MCLDANAREIRLKRAEAQLKEVQAENAVLVARQSVTSRILSNLRKRFEIY